ncbi:hypothetical protein [Pseudoduganella umbonata]|uniref:Uncharacterized protein n=1 Tax=Pseudoduganella umbonata TaxID=864828 RepID=A0A4P8HK69_9BURK|nr:hypothetical protein [Pseudoduganella umbonata]MBB3224989.1 hypothetical protein [Pseudoduganella umbonata]QCP09256.1 hypothetical protein FCL38_01505 [Pseudoduganella umbonata]
MHPLSCGISARAGCLSAVALALTLTLTLSLMLMLMLAPGLALASPAGNVPHLACEAEYGGAARRVEVMPVAGPYLATAVTVEPFRFKALMVGDARTILYIKLYTYYDTPQGVRLLQVSRYVSPALPTDRRSRDVTGRVRLYEPILGRQFTYICWLSNGPRPGR